MFYCDWLKIRAQNQVCKTLPHKSLGGMLTGGIPHARNKLIIMIIIHVFFRITFLVVFASFLLNGPKFIVMQHCYASLLYFEKEIIMLDSDWIELTNAKEA